MSDPANDNDRVTITDPGIERQVNEVYRRVSGDKTHLMETIGETILESVQENFQQEGRPQKWAPLAESTKAQRRRLGRSQGKLLNRSGATGLLGSINYQAGPESVSIGTNRVYAKTLHYGARRGAFGTITATVRAHTRRIRGRNVRVKAHTRKQQTPWGNIPGRPFLMIQTEDHETIADDIEFFMEEGST